MKTKATNLTPEQIESAWKTAVVVEGQDPRSIREDFLGAIIHRKDYDVNSQFGWCVEYILSPQLLEHHCGCSVEDAFCEENICVLNKVNYECNKDELLIGRYAIAYDACESKDQCPKSKSTSVANKAGKGLTNEYHHIKWVWYTNEAMISALKQKFHLSDDILREIFPQYNK